MTGSPMCSPNSPLAPSGHPLVWRPPHQCLAMVPSSPVPWGSHGDDQELPRLPVADRLSIAGLLVALLDLNRSEATFQRYDAIDALTLFRQLGISERMIDEFLRPILLVGLFKPPEELSAAVTMELLYYLPWRIKTLSMCAGFVSAALPSS